MTTLNADEAVSRGCALQCAILSPTFKVREFSVTDIQPFPIKLMWKTEQDSGEMVVFSKFHHIPFSKLLTFYRKDAFSIDALYENSEIESTGLPYSSDPSIGTFEVGEVHPMSDGTNQKIKVNVLMNLDGVFNISSATFVENQEIEEEVPMEVDENEAENEAGVVGLEAPEAEKGIHEQSSEGGPTAENAEINDGEKKDSIHIEKTKSGTERQKPPPKMVKRKKIVSKNVDLPVTPISVGSLPRDKLAVAMAQENKFALSDVQESERLVSKNAVEEYIYEIRDKINDELEEYMDEGSRQLFSNQVML